MKTGVILFHTVTEAFRLEKALRQAGLEVRLIPTPRQFSADCGIALEFGWAQAEEVRRIAAAENLQNAGMQEMNAAP